VSAAASDKGSLKNLEAPGSLGVWTWLDAMSAPESADFARQIEEWGYAALWVPEAVGRDPFTFLSYIAARTEKLVLATGIANIYARDPMTLKAIHKTLAEIAPGRFVLGIGVSHAHLVSKVRGHDYQKPLSTMRNYLDRMEQALYMGKEPEIEAPIVLAALRDKMLGLAAERTRGAHPYFVPVEHTQRAREILGEGPWLCPEQMVVFESDPDKARAIARENMAIYLGLPNYQNNLRQFGYTDSDFADGGSDRLVDDITVWGDVDAIAARISAHHAAGADHVCIQPFRSDGRPGPDLRLLERLAPAGA
jgi:probable F420-dependent oxidoreductase